MISWLHPWVYAAVIGLVLWFVVWVWSFSEVGVTDYLLFIVSGFFFIAVMLPLALPRVGRPHDDTNGKAATDDDKPSSFCDWARWDFDTWQGRLSGTHATMQILLPIAAAAFGMMALGIAFRIAERSV